jgi:cytochrome P450/NADPH-cytochrome P450 reductase
MTTKIPQPRGLPILGNIRTVDHDLPVISLYNLHLQYGDIYKLNILGEERILVGSQKLVHELADQTRFQKVVKGALREVRALAGDGEAVSRNT